MIEIENKFVCYFSIKVGVLIYKRKKIDNGFQ